MFVRHPVADFAAWKDGYDHFDAERKEMGVRGDAVFQALNDPKDVTVWHDFESKEEADAFVRSPRLKEVMDQAGVVGEPSIWFVRKA
jgi:hypothetical protein